MRAVVHDNYGPPDVLRIEDVERPVPEDDEVLVRVHATTVNRTDCHRRGADQVLWRLFAGLRKPKRRILGSEFAGEVEAVGAAVTEFAPGDQVFGLNPRQLGAHAEFVCVRASGLIARKPSGVSFEEAAAVCDGGLNALACLRRAKLRKGQQILIYGASGSIGTAAVQLARYFDADVTAVCDTRNLDVVRSLGPRQVIDYTVEDFTRSGQTYDLIYDAAGKHAFRKCKRSLRRGGTYLANDHWQNLVLGMWTSVIGIRKVMLAIPQRYTRQDVLFLKELVEAGKYRAVIDRRYRLEQVIDATRYVETQQKTGNVVLTVGDSLAR